MTDIQKGFGHCCGSAPDDKYPDHPLFVLNPNPDMDPSRVRIRIWIKIGILSNQHAKKARKTLVSSIFDFFFTFYL
jgi:hypothetical protein